MKCSRQTTNGKLRETAKKSNVKKRGGAFGFSTANNRPELKCFM